MSRKKPQGKKKGVPAASETEGWESLAEESERSLAPNPELEEALREAAEAVERRESGETPKAASGGAASPHLDQEIEDLSARLVESQDRLIRLQADFENFRRRALKERQEIVQYGHQNLVKDLLSTVDNLDRAIDHVRKGSGGDFEGLLKGVELVRKELLGVLAKHEIKEIEARGASFDPALHEAMAQAPDSSVPANTVIEVLQKGYQLRDRLVRPSRVIVAGGEKKQNEEGDASD